VADSWLTLLRVALAAELTADTGIRIEPGFIIGPVRDRVGCVFPGSRREREEDVQQAVAEVGIKLFRPFAQQREPTRPLDPTPLEEDAQTVIDALRDKQFEELGVPDVWFLRVTTEEFDLTDEQCVTLTVEVWGSNPFTA
jgi:hypothetical protein